MKEILRRNPRRSPAQRDGYLSLELDLLTLLKSVKFFLENERASRCNLKAPLIETDSPVEPEYERYPAEEPGYYEMPVDESK